jgi:regulator of sigma E protease
MEMLKSASYFIGVLSVLIIAHEWGHFVVAKLCKMRVDDFSLFFGPKLVCLGKRNGTEYNIRSIPLGGFVKIAGMEPEDNSSGGSPIFQQPKTGEGSVDWDIYKKTLVGINGGSFENIQFGNISERVVQSVSDAVGDNSMITVGGRENLEHMLLSTGLNKDEDLYIQAILAAAASRPDPAGYNQKPLWQRAAVIFAGPAMSLLFGYGLFCVMGFTTGLPDSNNQHMAIGLVRMGEPAQRAGLQPADQIIAVNGKPTDFDEAFFAMRSSLDPVSKSKPVPLTLTLLRNGSTINVTLMPYTKTDTLIDKHGAPIKGKNGKPETGYITMIGIAPDNVWTRYGLVDSVKQGTDFIKRDITSTFEAIFSKDVKNHVGGIISIGSQINENSKQGLSHVLMTAAMLSVSLGILNLFPIPVLDGGHLMLLLWEGVRRRRLTSREVYSAQMIGLSIIGFLFIFVMYNDVLRLIRKQ